MIRNYLKTTWRNLVKNKGYSAINIGGLAVGMATAMLIGLWVHGELTFNTYHKNYDYIAQVMQHANYNGEVKTGDPNPVVMASELRTKYGSHFKYVVQASWNDSHLLSVGDKRVNKNGVFFDPDAPEMLTLHMLKGTRAGLNNPYSIMLSASVAESLFGDEDPMNKTITIDRNQEEAQEVKVTGVYKDLPANSSFSDVEIIMPWALWFIQNPGAREWEAHWDFAFSRIFVQVTEQADMEKISAKIKNVILDNLGEEEQKHAGTVFLHPMRKWNLYNEFRNGVNTGGSIRYVLLFGIVGIFVLLLACINFMNLATARSEKRAREVGIRKTVGSHRWQLICRFFAESYITVLLAFVLSLLLVVLFLPSFNEVAGKKIRIPWSSPLFWMANLAFVFITGLLAGSYPALYLSSFRPLKVLKGTFKVGRLASAPRRVLVVIQFTVSVMLIIGTIIVYQQIQYAKNRPMGYTKTGLINLRSQEELEDHFDAFRTELINAGAIEEMAGSYNSLTNAWNSNSGFEWEGKDPNLTVNFPNNWVSPDFGKTVQWKIKAGRDFSRERTTDSMAVIINESAARIMAFENPIERTLRWKNLRQTESYNIIGVVGDILQESPFSPVRPTIYHFDSHDYMRNIVIKLNPEQSTSQSISSIEKVWKKYVADVPFHYTFVDEEFGKKFRAEERIGKLSSYFAVLAILISCLGLFGMASFVAEQRTKEIGIRKVLGASVANLLRLLSKEFVLLVMTSCIIAVPIAWYYLSQWLANYDYRIEISWVIFVLAAVLALVITLLTVGFQAIKAATANPVKSLRAE
ncbi:ABC transporter permease [Sinomicrobium weinanense]|uniref:ABC transporter permease n=1 Tax=Sinomicrobium weinanense TaxID=2842200 RepID=A0A926JNV7_9FLAO|nr:ABC transporter permease [Sinomicrobium weinanense]MBC9794760.1 ABC transporter permease [Sinomicrobium weinanense]MBU3125019.1 ABC transporter permease [Sinomicrobium weinanense]